MSRSPRTARVPRRFLRGLRILVTGASGFIGAHLCAELLAGGVETHAVYKTAPIATLREAHWHRCDLVDQQRTRRLIRSCKPDIVFHLASLVDGRRSTELVVPTFQNNLAATVNLLTAVADQGCSRAVLAGSGLEEPAIGAPGGVATSPYGAAKQASAVYARTMGKLFGLPTVILRPTMVYGPGQRDKAKLIPYVLDCLKAGRAPRLTSGAREVDWLYVDDAVAAFLAAASTEKLEGAELDLGSGEVASVRSVVEKLVLLSGSRVVPRFGDLPDRAHEEPRELDLSTTAALLGWHAEVSLDDGLRRTVRSYADLAA